MKKLIIGMLLLGTTAGGYAWLRAQRLTLSILDGVVESTKRGDLKVPIIASGQIEAKSMTKIKGEASGEVIKLPFNKGQMVTKGAEIVVLDPEDEQRRLDQAEMEYESRKHALTRAELAKEEAEGAGIKLAEARLKQAQAQQQRADYHFKNTQALDKSGVAKPMEVEEATVLQLDAMAGVLGAEAELVRANLMPKMAALEVEQARKAMENSEKALDDAKARLSDTTVASPLDGMVVSLLVQMGEIVQSGKSSLLGGTELMYIADVSEIYAVVNVDEADIGLVRELAPPGARPGPSLAAPATLPAEMLDDDQQVEVTVESFPDETFYGVIEEISPKAESIQAIATFQVRVRVTSPNREKLVGMLDSHCEAHFTAKSVRDAILVPYDAIQKDPNGEGYGVYVPVHKPGHSRRGEEFRPCKLGVDDGAWVEVADGLEEGEEVYVKRPQQTRKEQEAADNEEELD